MLVDNNKVISLVTFVTSQALVFKISNTGKMCVCACVCVRYERERTCATKHTHFRRGLQIRNKITSENKRNI